MLESYDFLIMFLIVYAAVVTALSTVMFGIYNLGMKKLNIVFKNDIPHFVDNMTDRAIKKGLNKLKSINAHRAKAAKKVQQQQPTMLQQAIGFAMSPEGSEMIKGLLGGRGQSPPQGGAQPPVTM